MNETDIQCLQLYARRKKYVKKGEEKYWNDIDASFMSEESTHECDGELVVRKHTPTFRSEGLPLHSTTVCIIHLL